MTRLIDMGIEHFLIGSTIRGVMAQRLVRRLCQDCAQPHERSSYWTKHLTDERPALNRLGHPRLLQPGGCEKCHQSGFRGRLSIAELLSADASVQQAILQRKPASDIETIARQNGMTTMYEDGIAKAWRGLTTVEEVVRVTDAC
jgi:general secretion pathway protein E